MPFLLRAVLQQLAIIIVPLILFARLNDWRGRSGDER
jgi:hypothetical protein